MGLSYLSYRKEVIEPNAKNEDSIYCSKCGEENKNEDKFCAKYNTAIN
ncbi:MAG: zinc-ribbon domain-containing protein [Ignavibacteriaceae bacterium]